VLRCARLACPNLPERSPPSARVKELAPVIDEARVILELTNLRQVSEIMERMHTAHGQLLEFAVHSPNLSDSFITLTGHGLCDMAD
jgi:hypothetical protein